MLIKFLAVLLYLVMEDGAAEVRLEQKAYKSEEECMASTVKRVEEVQARSNFADGLFAACLKVPVKEV